MTTASVARTEVPKGVGFWPQVDLLPPEARAGRKLKQTKRLLALVLLAVVLLAALGWVYALFTLNDAKSERAAAEAEYEELSGEQAQYAEVPRIKGQLADARGALEQGTATEVLWKQYLEALRKVTPPAVSYESMQVAVSTDPAASMSSDPLQGPSVGRITFTGQAETVQDLSAWMDAVSGVTGLADPWFTQAAVTDKDGHVFYQVNGTVQITDAALAHRFAEAGEDSRPAAGSGAGDAGETSDDGAADDDTSTGGNS